MQVTLYDPYLSAYEVVFHEGALYQVYVPLPLPFTSLCVVRLSCPAFMLSFFFINCIIKYCCLSCWRPAVMASALPVAFRTLFTCLFIFMFGFCAKNEFFFFFFSDQSVNQNAIIKHQLIRRSQTLDRSHNVTSCLAFCIIGMLLYFRVDPG